MQKKSTKRTPNGKETSPRKGGSTEASGPFTFAEPREKGQPAASMEQVKEWARIICPYGAESGEEHKLPALLLLLSEIAIALEAKDYITIDLIVDHARLAAFGESDHAIEAEKAFTAKQRNDAGITAEVVYQ